MLTIRGISKTFNAGKPTQTTALQDITLEFKPGDIVGFLGPNGSGKTTLIKIIAGLVYPDTGEITFAGGQKPLVSVVLDGGRSLYWRLTVTENLKYLSALRSVPAKRVNDVIERFDLTQLANSLPGCRRTGVQVF